MSEEKMVAGGRVRLPVDDGIVLHASYHEVLAKHERQSGDG